MQSTPLPSLSPQVTQVKKPLARWWWISLLIGWIVCWVVGAALLGVGLGYQDGSNSTDGFVTVMFAGIGILGVGLLFKIAFWVVFAVRRKQRRRFLAATANQPVGASAPTTTISTEQPQLRTQPSVKPWPQYGAVELSEQYILGQHYHTQHSSPITQSPSTVAELATRRGDWHWIPTQPVEAPSASLLPIAELPAPTTSSYQPTPPAPSVAPSPAPLTKIVEIDDAIAAIDGLASGIDSVIQADFDYVSRLWGSEEILVLDKAAIGELLYKVVQDDLTAGFRSRSVVTHEGNRQHPPYLQLSTSSSETFRPYRIARHQDGRLVLYGHGALYRAKRALGRSKKPSVIPSAADLITELIDVGHAEGALLAPTGSELWGRVQLIGLALNDAGGKNLMLQAHEAVRGRLGSIRARELEVAWNGVGSWLG